MKGYNLSFSAGKTLIIFLLPSIMLSFFINRFKWPAFLKITQLLYHSEKYLKSLRRKSRLMGNKLQHFFLPQSSRSPTKPTYFMPCAPPPTMTLCCVSAGDATGDIWAPLPVLELKPRTARPSEQHLPCWLTARSTSIGDRGAAHLLKQPNTHICGCLELLIATRLSLWSGKETPKSPSFD